MFTNGCMALYMLEERRYVQMRLYVQPRLPRRDVWVQYRLRLSLFLVFCVGIDFLPVFSAFGNAPRAAGDIILFSFLGFTVLRIPIEMYIAWYFLSQVGGLSLLLLHNSCAVLVTKPAFTVAHSQISVFKEPTKAYLRESLRGLCDLRGLAGPDLDPAMLRVGRLTAWLAVSAVASFCMLLSGVLLVCGFAFPQEFNFSPAGSCVVAFFFAFGRIAIGFAQVRRALSS